jgi:hypothetical protein
VLTAAAALAAALAAGEGLARIDALFPGAVYSASAMRAHLERLVAAADYGDLLQFAPSPNAGDPSDHRPIPDPWSGWTSPAHVERFAAASAWFGGSEHATSFDVLVLGGSFAAQFGNRLADAHLPALLPAGSAVDRPVRLWNLAHAAQKQPSHLHRLTTALAAGWQPDLVLLVDGFNEVAIGAQNAEAGIAVQQPSVAFWESLARAGDIDGGALDRLVEIRAAQIALAKRARAGLDAGLWRSALASRVWLARLASPKARLAAAREHHRDWLALDRGRVAVRGPRVEPVADPAAPAGVREAVRAWREAARQTRWICDGHGVPLVHVVQPALDDEGAKLTAPEERRFVTGEGIWPRAIQSGYPLLRTAIAELASEGVLVHDATRIYAQVAEPLFVDACHLNERGYDLLTAAVATWAQAAHGGY